MNPLKSLRHIFNKEHVSISLAKENGFNSIKTMRKAHEPILQLACAVLPQKGGNVLDLGCGNGVLLKTLRERHCSIAPFGIEYNPSVATSAKSLQPEFSDNFFSGQFVRRLKYFTK